MARRRWLGTVAVYLILELGALCGVPVRPDEVERMSRLANGSLVTQVERREDDGDPPLPGTEKRAGPLTRRRRRRSRSARRRRA
jgi:hypothetical protein